LGEAIEEDGEAVAQAGVFAVEVVSCRSAKFRGRRRAARFPLRAPGVEASALRIFPSSVDDAEGAGMVAAFVDLI